jgi:branched-chain amino acid transport system substrate-binding protein
MRHDRRSMWIGISVLAGLFLFLSSQTSYAQTGGDTIKVGILCSFTGPFSEQGNQIRRAADLYLERAGGKLGGVKAQFVYEDEEGVPSVAVTKAKRLIELEKVDAIIGPMNSAAGLAIREQVIRNKVPTLVSGTVEGILDAHYIFRTTFAALPEGYLQGVIAGKDGHKKAIIVCPDFVAGRVGAQGYRLGFASRGGKVVQEIFTPVGTMDYGPYLVSFSKEADAGLVFFPGGGDSIRFIKQYGEYGLRGKLPLYGYPAVVDEESLPEMGSAALGFKGAAFYFSTIDSPENKSFVKDYVSRHKKPPSWAAASGYIQAQAIDEAAKKLGGKVRDREAFVKALKAVNLRTPAGVFRFDEKNEPIQPRYTIEIKEVEKGRLAPVIIDTVPEYVQVTPK